MQYKGVNNLALAIVIFVDGWNYARLKGVKAKTQPIEPFVPLYNLAGSW